MKTTAPDITEMGIVQILETVLGGQIPENSGSPAPREGLVERGVITSNVARSLFSASSIMSSHIKSLGDEHKRLHQEETSPARHECDAFYLKMKRLCLRNDVLRKLLWQSIFEEYPVATAHDVKICDGWRLMSREGDWDGTVPVSDKTSIANDYTTRLASIVRDKSFRVVKDEDFETAKNGEEVVGLLSDKCVQSFRTLMDEIHDELEARFPVGITDADSDVINNMTVNQINQLLSLSSRFDLLSKMTSTLFWCGVRDTVPAAIDIPSIGIRRGWNVVKRITEDPEDEGIIMTPLGPALVVNLSTFRS